jgi:hypothetical protein
MDDFRYLNPFENAAVHEDEVWGEEQRDRFDVESIHAEVSRALLEDLRHVAAKQATRVRFLVGAPGIGKSHLFSRLRRQLSGAAAFALASMPPTRAEGLPYWLLERVIAGLQHPRWLDGEQRAFSQLDALIYRLLIKYDPGLQNQTEDVAYEVLDGVEPDDFTLYLAEARNLIRTPDANDALVGGLLQCLRPESRRLALRWLSGSSNLSEEELALIGQSNVLDESGVRSLLVLIGQAARMARLPIVLALDQLDLMTQPAQIDAFQDLLLLLLNKSFNWYIVVGLNLPRYEEWLPRFTEPLMTRLTAQGGGAVPILELRGVREQPQKQALLERRLASELLQVARAQHRIDSALFPLSAKDLEQLAGSPEAIAPRSLLTQAATLYERRVQAPGEPAHSKRPLSEAVKVEYELRRARLTAEPTVADRAVIADRVADVVRLVALKQGCRDIKMTTGILEGNSPGAGTHNIFTLDQRQLHVIGHHVHKGGAFPAFVKKALALSPGAIFVRVAAVSTSGARSAVLVQQLRQHHVLVLLTQPELADLDALAQLLADLRAGDLHSLDTDPEPSDAALMQAITELPVFETLPLAQAIQRSLTNPAPRTAAAAPENAVAAAPVAKPSMPAVPPTLVKLVHDIMQPLRWLAVERLCWLLRRQHQLNYSADELGLLLRTPQFEDMLELHPNSVLTPGQPQIIIFLES